MLKSGLALAVSKTGKPLKLSDPATMRSNIHTMLSKFLGENLALN